MNIEQERNPTTTEVKQEVKKIVKEEKEEAEEFFTGMFNDFKLVFGEALNKAKSKYNEKMASRVNSYLDRIKTKFGRNAPVVAAPAAGGNKKKKTKRRRKNKKRKTKRR